MKDLKSHRAWLRVVNNVDKHTRSNHMAKLRMRKKRCLDAGGEWDSEAGVCIWPPEEAARREAKKAKRAMKKKQRAVSFASLPKPTLKRKLEEASDALAADKKAKEEAAAASDTLDVGQSLPDDTVMNVDNPEVADLDNILQVDTDVYKKMTKDQLLAELEIRDATIAQQVFRV